MDPSSTPVTHISDPPPPPNMPLHILFVFKKKKTTFEQKLGSFHFLGFILGGTPVSGCHYHLGDKFLTIYEPDSSKHGQGSNS